MRDEYPIFWREFMRLIGKVAQVRAFVNKVARKAGLTAGIGTLPRTVVDGFLSPDERVLGRQYVTDLTGQSEILLRSRSAAPVYLLYSADLSQTEDPGDWENVSSGLYASASTSPDWTAIAEGAKGPVRLAPSTSTTPAWAPAHGFAFSAQVQ